MNKVIYTFIGGLVFCLACAGLARALEFDFTFSQSGGNLVVVGSFEKVGRAEITVEQLNRLFKTVDDLEDQVERLERQVRDLERQAR